jgi:uncharacterized protein YjbI with pentapeptide repeats
MADIAKVQHKVMGWNDNKTGEQSSGLKVEVAIFIFLILAILLPVCFWLRVGWPSEIPENVGNLLTVEAVNDYIEYKEQIRATQLQYLTTLAASLGAIGVVFNLYYTGKREEAFNKSANAALRNAEAAQDKQITERFTKAVEQLASQEIAVRLGGIYALERIAKDSEKDHWTIMEVLTAFVREPPPLKAPLEAEKPLLELPTYIQKTKDDKQSQKLRIDIQAALTVIGRRDMEKDLENQKLDLRNADIAGANIREAQLQGVILRKANLQGANLEKANLQQANLIEANLQQANLTKAHLQGAILIDAQLQEAYLEKAQLQGAELGGAKLQGARLSHAQLQGAFLQLADMQSTRLSHAQLQEANLRQANLQRADLNKANLEGADLIRAELQSTRLSHAQLQGAKLMQANLQGANLEGADLNEANLKGASLLGAENLTQQQIESASGDSTTVLPNNLTIPEKWRQSE